MKDRNGSYRDIPGKRSRTRVATKPLEIGDLLKQRKDIYEELYPETKAGTAQAIGMNKANR